MDALELLINRRSASRLAEPAPTGEQLQNITVVAKCEENHKVPRWEQEMSAGCAVMAMQMAAVAQGFGGIWRSGALTESPVVREAFGCREQDKIVGFLYLGTPQLKASTSINVPDPTPFVTYF